MLVLWSRWGDSSGTWYRFHMLVVLSLMYWVSDIMCSAYALSDHCCQSGISYCTYRWLSMLYIHEASVAEKFCPGEGRKGNFHLIMFALHFADLCYMLFYNFLIRCYRVRIMWPVLQTVQAIHSLIRFSMLMPLWEKKIIPFQFYIFTVQRLLSGRLGMQDSIGKPNYGSHIIFFKKNIGSRRKQANQIRSMTNY